MNNKYISITIVGLTGLALLVRLLAAAGYQSIEAENSAVQSPATIENDAGASNGSYLKFAADNTFLSGELFNKEYTIGDTNGWRHQGSGATERVDIKSDRLECFAGGYDAYTHYARLRRDLAQEDDFASFGRFSIESTFELPSNFYDQHESYMRLITVDNYPDNYKSTGVEIGANDTDEWRVGFTIYGNDALFRLTSDHQNNKNITLWKNNTILPVGTHTVKINFDPSQTNNGAWELYIDGELIGSQTGVQTVPETLEPDEVVVTHISGCIDGASAQDTKIIQANLFTLVFNAEI